MLIESTEALEKAHVIKSVTETETLLNGNESWNKRVVETNML